MENSRCSICGMERQISNKGSLTQFISSCKCTSESKPGDHLKEVEVEICSVCGKRIGRKGSVTQLIFAADNCDCVEPQPVSETVRTSDDSITYDELIVEDEDELELSRETFPVGRYKPVKKLGEGGAGIVCLARDRLLNKLVAVKTLHVLSIKELVTFQKEALATSRLDHPNIIMARDFGSTEFGTPYMVLEYFESTPLSSIIQQRGQLDWTALKPVVEQICEALSYSHKHGIFHRDIKPSNILIDDIDSPDMQVKLIDFGIARVVEATGTTVHGKTIIGTPLYMSPDASFGLTFSASSEVYSLGVVIFHALTGKVPFEADTSFELLKMHATQPPPLMSNVSEKNIPDEAESIVAKCLKKEASERFESMDEVIQQLRTVPEAEGDTAQLDQTSNNRVKVIVAASILVGIVGFTLYFRSLHDARVEEKMKAKAENNVAIISLEERKHDYNYVYVPLWLRPAKSIGSFTDGDFEALVEELKGRKSIALDLSRFELTGSGFTLLRDLPIRYLTLENAKFDEGFLYLLDNPTLRGIVLAGTDVSDRGLEELGKVKSLQVLNLERCKRVSDLSIGNLLRNSDISDVVLSKTRIGDQFLNTLGQAKLKRISLNRTRITDKGIRNLAKLKNLTELEVNDCKLLSLDGVSHVLKKGKLQLLSMAYINFDRGSISSIPKCKDLTFLNIMGAPVTDEDLRLLAKMDNLSTLHLSNAKITDAGLRHLYRMKLANLTISNCTSLTAGGISALRKALPPNCYIVTGLNIDSTFGLNKELVAPFLEATDVEP